MPFKKTLEGRCLSSLLFPILSPSFPHSFLSLSLPNPQTWCCITMDWKAQKLWLGVNHFFFFLMHRKQKTPWVNEVLSNMGTVGQGLQDKLTYDKLAKPLAIWARLKREAKLSLEVWVFINDYECGQRLGTGTILLPAAYSWDCSPTDTSYWD